MESKYKVKVTPKDDRPYLDEDTGCDHEYRIFGLDASLCGKCNKWIMSVTRLEYMKKKSKRR